jgi:hypothetical protein
MKMGTIALPWRYDAATAQAIRPDNLRWIAILRYASWAAVFPISWVVRSPFDCGHFDQSRERRDGSKGDFHNRVEFGASGALLILTFLIIGLKLLSL